MTLGFGAVGWVDDYRKVVHRNPKGLSARAKFFWQSVIGLVAALLPRAATPAQLPAARDSQLIVPFFKTVAYPLGALGFIMLDLLRDRRHLERGEPHRRAGRPRHHADGDGRRRRSASSPTSPATRCSRSTSASPTSRAPASWRCSAARWPARGSASSGSTPIRRRCSWATSARWRSAPRSAPSP